MLYMCNLLCSALFEIMMDNSKMPIVIYKEPKPNTSNAVTESDIQSTLNELCEEKTLLKGIKKILGTPLVSKN